MLRNKFEEIENLDARKKTALYFGIPILFLGLFYFLFLSSAFDDFGANQQKIDSLQAKLKKPTLRVTSSKIVHLKKEIIKNKTQIDEDKQKLIFFQNKLDSKSFLFITKKSTSIFLDRLLDNSVKKNVLPLTITLHNKNTPYIGNLKLKKVIDVNASGKFLNELSFLRSIEESTMLMKVENVQITLKDTNIPSFSFKVKFYGVER